ncbi:hypothetical protein K402DRAFT_202434 [Aulographum hederae CBS 113979]|uniref:Uncharacterized protein n=1 Tax=Aulographum hederae CBS 113979 TaxID=1176131 RepID=A0A6G1HCD7_9PEZI|nr:hypothetical protein K402DRAFT_202434 [Aulographum hederae CBS 113979]
MIASIFSNAKTTRKKVPGPINHHFHNFVTRGCSLHNIPQLHHIPFILINSLKMPVKNLVISTLFAKFPHNFS